MKPALEPHEWDGGETWWPAAALQTTRGGQLVVATEDLMGTVVVDEKRRHAVAALALVGQPYGFTWDDVELCEVFANGWPTDSPEAKRILGLRDRIASLLPPRDWCAHEWESWTAGDKSTVECKKCGVERKGRPRRGTSEPAANG